MREPVTNTIARTLLKTGVDLKYFLYVIMLHPRGKYCCCQPSLFSKLAYSSYDAERRTTTRNSGKKPENGRKVAPEPKEIAAARSVQ
jgi:hypothetical protein